MTDELTDEDSRTKDEDFHSSDAVSPSSSSSQEGSISGGESTMLRDQRNRRRQRRLSNTASRARRPSGDDDSELEFHDDSSQLSAGGRQPLDDVGAGTILQKVSRKLEFALHHYERV